jgi:lipoate-protein ligase A
MMSLSECRLILDPPAPGAWNMAVDEVLLADAADRAIATLRFYQWSEPTLSLGYFQQYEDRFQHAASRDAAVVRRQSGGGAILHDHELTYSLALPAAHPLARHAERLYTAMHEAIISALAPRIATSAPEWTLEMRRENSDLPARDEPFLCFQRRARGDILALRRGTIGRPPMAWKILGSAQRRRRGAILQHGSLVLEKSAAAPEIAGVGDLIDVHFTTTELTVILPEEFAATLGVRYQESGLPEHLQRVVAALESRKYAALAWTKRR